MKINTDGLKEVESLTRKGNDKVQTARKKISSITVPSVKGIPKVVKVLSKRDSNYFKNLAKEIDGIISNITKSGDTVRKTVLMFELVENQNSALSPKDLEWLMKNMNKKEAEWLMKNISDKKFFEIFKGEGGRYGVDQGVFRDLINENPEEYKRIKKILMEEYNMSAKDAEKVFYLLDSKGACSYAATSNDIIAKYRNNPKEFEKKFGFPLYKKTKDGTYKINDTELLLDLFLGCNGAKKNGKSSNIPEGIFYTGKDGKTRIDKHMYTSGYDKKGDLKFSLKAQRYLSGGGGTNTDLISKYLSNKGENVTSKNIVTSDEKIDDKKMKDIIEKTKKEISEGKQITLRSWI